MAGAAKGPRESVASGSASPPGGDEEEASPPGGEALGTAGQVEVEGLCVQTPSGLGQSPIQGRPEWLGPWARQPSDPLQRLQVQLQARPWPQETGAPG